MKEEKRGVKAAGEETGSSEDEKSDSNLCFHVPAAIHSQESETKSCWKELPMGFEPLVELLV